MSTTRFSSSLSCTYIPKPCPQSPPVFFCTSARAPSFLAGAMRPHAKTRHCSAVPKLPPTTSPSACARAHLLKQAHTQELKHLLKPMIDKVDEAQEDAFAAAILAEISKVGSVLWFGDLGVLWQPSSPRLPRCFEG